MKDVTPTEIANCILEATEGRLSTENLEMLVRYVPTNDEVCCNYTSLYYLTCINSVDGSN